MLQINGGRPGLLRKLVGLAAGAVLLVLVFTLSLLFFAVLIAGGLLAWGFLWWKTRQLRRELQEQMRQRPPGERVIEGEVITNTEELDEHRSRGDR